VALTRIPTRVRLTLASAALAALIGGGTVVLPHIAGATPGQPTIAEATAKLDKLARQNEVLAEQYNRATADVQARQKAADAAQREALAAASDFDKARSRLRETVTAEYESASFSHVGALLTSRDGQSYLDTLYTLNLISTHRAEIVQQIDAVHADAQAAQKKASKLLTDAQAKAAALDKQKKQIEADTKKFKDLLARLTAQQQAAYRKRNTVDPRIARASVSKVAPTRAQGTATSPAQGTTPPAQDTTPPAQGTTTKAQRAVAFAIQQVGKAYVFAGSGPDAYDCSGLTMAAWAQGGVSLPHNAAEQATLGTSVSASELQPGDLVFLYQPISHVEIMVGPDLAVSAANEALGVRYVHPSQDMQDWAGAVRLT
jgi:peptidoglycan DL-endopeptidase CwlO